jgi:hypothetical protein
MSGLGIGRISAAGRAEKHDDGPIVPRQGPIDDGIPPGRTEGEREHPVGAVRLDGLNVSRAYALSPGFVQVPLDQVAILVEDLVNPEFDIGVVPGRIIRRRPSGSEAGQGGGVSKGSTPSHGVATVFA